MQIYKLALSCSDTRTLLKSISSWFPEPLKCALDNSDGRLPVTGWQDVFACLEANRAKVSQGRAVFVELDPDDVTNLILRAGYIKFRAFLWEGRRFGEFDWDLMEWFEALKTAPFRFGTFWGPWSTKWFEEYEHEPVGLPEQGDYHGSFAAIKGDAHEWLVSRRWLEFGPWRLLRDESSDLSLIQFHDVDLPLEEYEKAVLQAHPGHERLDDLDTGGSFWPEYHSFKHTLRGFYLPEKRQLKIVVHGRKVSAREMLDACVLRYKRRNDPEEPLDSVGFMFVEEEEAKAHLHELWLRELECWLVVEGQEVRLDTDYHPKPEPPEWVQEVESRTNS